MSASYYGTFPVKTVISTSVMGNGILSSTAKIIAKEGDGEDLIPDINSSYEFDSRLWVTQASLSQSGNGFDEINITAMGPVVNPSTTAEVQPGGPLIWGLGGSSGGLATRGADDFPARFGSNIGSTVKVSFVDNAGQEGSLISAYQDLLMPDSIGGIALPLQNKQPGFYETSEKITRNNQVFAFRRMNYRGFIGRDFQMQRMGSALSVSIVFRESGTIEQFEPTSATVSSYRVIFEA